MSFYPFWLNPVYLNSVYSVYCCNSIMEMMIIEMMKIPNSTALWEPAWQSVKISLNKNKWILLIKVLIVNVVTSCAVLKKQFKSPKSSYNSIKAFLNWNLQTGVTYMKSTRAWTNFTLQNWEERSACKLYFENVFWEEKHW